VGKLDLNAPAGAREAPVELPVNLSFRTLAEAAAAAKGGDLVAVLPGKYRGFTLRSKPDAGDERYIHFKALGNPGEVVIDRPGDDPNWMILLQGAHHVVLQGFAIAGAASPDDEDPRPKAGILLDGDFRATSTFSHHVAVVGNYAHHHGRWGFHSVDSRTVLLQDNLFSHSAKEHGAYVSDGSDDYVIRRNVFFQNVASGLQCNVDPLASLEKLRDHPAMRDHPPPNPPTRDWAVSLIKVATDRFGMNNFPDGRGFNYIIEDNVMNGNGRIGGGAVNLAGVRESLVQNNLVYGNLASGIVEWNNANPYDAAQDKPGPKTPADVTGPEVLGLFGCFNNVVRNNTVLTAVKGRPALLAGNGSWGTRAYNNVLVNDETPSIELLNTSIWRFDGCHNVLNRVNYEGPAAALKSLAIHLPDDNHSITLVTRSFLASSFVSPNDREPWVVEEGGWWKLNPKRPDFHPKAGAGLLSGKADSRNMPKHDLEGKRRSSSDIGAFSAAGP
jgi:hypothetical protein